MNEQTFSEKRDMIEATELLIDEAKPLYLITWAPDPSKMPDCHFEYQHRYNIELLSLYCKACYVGIFCVESSQLGNPHYHGFYQLADNDEARISLIKVFQKLGIVKVKKAKYWKINKYTERKNALYYYKKDVFSSMRHIVDNPVTYTSKCGIDWGNTHYFDSTINPRNVHHVNSERQSLISFYKDSTL